MIRRIVRGLRARMRSYLAERKRRLSGRIVLGAGGTVFDGWLSTDRDTLDVTRHEDFASRWRTGSLVAILAEHVWEHLTEEQRAIGNRNCHAFLREGGWLRIAVPDGLHPDPGYLEYVRPGGSGAGADDHKVLFDYRSMSAELRAAGFEVRLIEYWDEAGEFHHRAWRSEDGHVSRSRDHDDRNAPGRLAYTSLIVDAVKRR